VKLTPAVCTGGRVLNTFSTNKLFRALTALPTILFIEFHYVPSRHRIGSFGEVPDVNQCEVIKSSGRKRQALQHP